MVSDQAFQLAKLYLNYIMMWHVQLIEVILLD